MKRKYLDALLALILLLGLVLPVAAEEVQDAPMDAETIHIHFRDSDVVLEQEVE